MSAVEKIQDLWKELVFAKVDRTITNSDDKLQTQISGGDAWAHYFGFAKVAGKSVYFQRSDYDELDLNIDLTLDFSKFGNHHGGWVLPQRGQMICGVVKETPRGPRFDKWFVCPPPIMLLINAVRNGTDKTEEELARVMMMPGYPDEVWAIARLVLFTNVEAFVDAAHYSYDHQYNIPPHPAHGLPTGTVMDSGRQLVVDHKGLWLSQDVRKWIHVMSYRFDPSWWDTFCTLMTKRDLPTDHQHHGDYCLGCAAEKPGGEDGVY